MAEFHENPHKTLNKVLAHILAQCAECDPGELEVYFEHEHGINTETMIDMVFRNLADAPATSEMNLRVVVNKRGGVELDEELLHDEECEPFGEPETSRDRINGAASLLHAAQLLMDDDPPEARRLAAKAGEYLLGRGDD